MAKSTAYNGRVLNYDPKTFYSTGLSVNFDQKIDRDGPGVELTKLYFLHDLRIGPIKLECSSLPNLLSVMQCNILAFWAH